jgi:hypothetical protein
VKHIENLAQELRVGMAGDCRMQILLPQDRANSSDCRYTLLQQGFSFYLRKLLILLKLVLRNSTFLID